MKKIYVLLLVVLCLTFAGCGSGGQEPAPGPGAEVSGAVSRENLQFAPADVGKNFFADSQADGLYCANNGVLSYYDLESGSSAILCPQTGCSHSGENCPAYLGSSQYMAIYQGTVYTITESIDMHTLTVARCPLGQTGRTEIGRITASEGTYLSGTSGTVSHGNIFLTVAERDEEDQNRYALCWISGETGAVTKLETGRSGEYICFYGASTSVAAVECRTYSGQPPQLDDYAEYEEYIAAWDAFEKAHGLKELRLYDLRSGTYTVLVDSRADGYTEPTEYGGCIQDDLLLYQLDKSLWTYDLATGENTYRLTQEDLVNYSFEDGKILTITRDANNVLGCYITPLGGEPAELKGAMGEDCIRFGAAYETPQYFVGLFDGQRGYYKISKADFFAGRYDNVTLVSEWG